MHNATISPLTALDTLALLSRIVGSPSFESALDVALEHILEQLPVEAAAVVMNDSSAQNLLGYASAGAFKEEAVRSHFVFSSESHERLDELYLIPAAFGLLSAATREDSPKLGSLSALGEHLNLSSDLPYFFVADVPTVASMGGIRVLDVYEPGYKLKSFLALPLFSGFGNGAPEGLLVLNNLKDIRLVRPQSKFLERVHAYAALLAQAMNHLSLRYQFTRINQILAGLRPQLANFAPQPGTGWRRALHAAAQFASGLLTKAFDADGTALFLISNGEFELLWPKLPKQPPFSLADLEDATRESLAYDKKLLQVTDNGASLRSSNIILQLWSNFPRTAQLVLALQREPVGMAGSGDRFCEAFLPEDRQIAFYLEGEISHWLQLIVESQARVDDTAEHWRNLAAKTAHKLKSPLEAVRLDLSLLQRKSADIEIRKQLGLTLSKVDRVFEQVKDFGRFTGSSKLKLAPTNLTDLIRESAKEVFGDKEPGGREVELHLADDLPVIAGDSHHLRAAVTELLYNARKYRKKGLVKVTARRGEITANASVYTPHEQNEPKEQVKIEVWNRGKIDEELLKDDQVFEPFVTGDETGTGIGLAYVSEVVRNHGGCVQVKSDNQGTTFLVYLPISSSHA